MRRIQREPSDFLTTTTAVQTYYIDHFIVIKRRRQFLMLQEAFDDYSHTTICFFITVQNGREEFTVSISFPQNACQNFCSSLLDHFIVIKRQRYTFTSSREAFDDFSHLTFCCMIRVQPARIEEFSVSISFAHITTQICCSSLLDHLVVFKRQRQSY